MFGICLTNADLMNNHDKKKRIKASKHHHEKANAIDNKEIIIKETRPNHAMSRDYTLPTCSLLVPVDTCA